MANHLIPNHLFILWLQGWHRAPKIVQHCRRSWEHHNPSWKIHILSRDNLADYLDITEFEGTFDALTPQATSDIIRIHLLHKYGGVWADATCFCCKPLNEWLHHHTDSGYFAFSRPKKNRIISSWFLAARSDSYIVNLLHQETRKYWLKNPMLKPLRSRKSLVRFLRMSRIHALLETYPHLWHHPLVVNGLKVFPYCWFHYLFEHCYRKDTEFRSLWNATNKIDAQKPHRIQRMGMLTHPTDDIKKEIETHQTPVYKLSWRKVPMEIPKQSTLAYLVDTLPSNDLCELNQNEAYYITRSDTTRLIYFINPKCGSTTIKAFLATNDPLMNVDKKKIGQNGTFKNVDTMESISSYGEYFKFTFVRNPWDRLVSCYLEKIVQQDRWVNIFGQSPSFSKFVRIIHGISDEEANRHWRSQHTNVTDSRGNLVVDFVGRFEAFERDMTTVAAVRKLNPDIAHYRKSSRRPSYRTYYTTTERNLAAERYAIDIALFDYQF